MRKTLLCVLLFSNPPHPAFSVAVYFVLVKRIVLWYNGAMPAPVKLPTGTLVLSPKADSEPQSFMLGRVATRVAFTQKLMPIFPTAYCMAFMTEEEIGRRLKDVTLWWFKRCSKIWLCMERKASTPELDPVTHDILLVNEGLMAFPDKGRHFTDANRLPIYRFSMPTAEDEPPTVRLIDREELSSYLSCNITSGLFRGVGEATQEQEDWDF